MNKLLEYQLTSIDYQGTMDEEKSLSFLRLVNDAYDKADEYRAYQREMLTLAKDKIRTLSHCSETDTNVFKIEKRYQRLIENLQPYYFFYSKNNEGRFTSISESVYSMLGFTSSEFIEKYTGMFSYGLRCDVETKMLVSEYGFNTPHEITLKNKQGLIFHLEITEYLIFDDDKIVGIEGIVRNITEQTLHKKRISTMLYNDTLTGISNRLHLEVMMEKLIVEQYNRDNTFAMIFIDIDHFKHINDTLGHDIGDILLQNVTSNISDVIRQNDIFARIGGDEFVLIFKNMDEIQIANMVQKLMHTISEIHKIQEYKLHVTASIGIVMYPEDGKTTVDLMKRADIAMYESKKRGRNTYTFFKETYGDSLSDEMIMMQDMSLSIDKNEFELYYQPKVSVKSNEVVAAEALVRWNHPKLGFIAPDRFILLAENTGLILKLGRWIIQEVCKFIVSFNSLQNDQTLNIAINISLRQFQQENLYDILKENIEKYNREPLKIPFVPTIS